MSNNLTPPAAPSTDATLPVRTPRGRVASTVFLVCGLTLAAAGVASAAAATARVSGTTHADLSAATAGVSDVEIGVSVTDFRVEFADVDEASLVVDSSRNEGVGAWTLKRDGDTLRVDEGGGWLNFGWNWGVGGKDTAILTLPAELNGAVSLDLENSAGSSQVVGDFTSAELSTSAGKIEFTGRATDLSADVSAGSIVLQAEVTGTADIGVSAGEVKGSLTGVAPRATSIDVSAGTVRLSLPDEIYSVERDQSAGDISVGVRTATQAQKSLKLEVSAGDIEISVTP